MKKLVIFDLDGTLLNTIDVIGDDIRLLMTQGLDDPFPSRQRHVSTTFLFLFFTSWFHYSAFSPDGGGKIVRFNSIFRYNLLDYAVREVYAMNVQNALEHAEDIRRLSEARVDAVLIGETLMRSSDKEMTLRQLKGR